jgi:hypothetical protein
MVRPRSGVSRPGANGRDPARPADALRALTDAQRRGVEAASEVFDRLIAEIAGREAPRVRVDEDVDVGSGPDGARPTTLSQMRAAVAGAVDLYADLFRETFQAYADVLELAARGRGGTVSSSEGAGAPVALAGGPGQQATTAVWVHNATGSPFAGIALRVTDLAAHDGVTVRGAAASFSPAVLDVGAGASASATLTLSVPRAAPAGAYHGHVLATGLPEASIPVRLVVG